MNADPIGTAKTVASTTDSASPQLLQGAVAAVHPQPAASTSALAVQYRPIAELTPYPKSARTHSQRQIRKIADSIEQFGFTNPVLIDAEDIIIAGHGRVQAAKLLKLASVPTIRLESLTPSQVRAYVLADNRLAEDAGWDKQILKIELQHLVLENEIDISVIGFEVPELDLIFGHAPALSDPLDELPPGCSEVVARPGDLWQLGEHRIFCGDGRSEASFRTLMANGSPTWSSSTLHSMSSLMDMLPGTAASITRSSRWHRAR